MEQNRDDPAHAAPPEWVDALDRARAGVAAGRTTPWSELRARLIAEVSQTDPAIDRRRA